MQLRGYRFLFFDQPHREPVAVFILRLKDDETAGVEADALLAISTHSLVEVWRGSQRVHTLDRAQGSIGGTASAR